MYISESLKPRGSAHAREPKLLRAAAACFLSPSPHATVTVDIPVTSHQPTLRGDTS